MDYDLEKLYTLYEQEVDNGIDAQMVRRDVYTEVYHLMDSQENYTHPLSGVLMNKREDTYSYGRFAEELFLFAFREYSTLWGISWLEYLDLPYYVSRMMHEFYLDIKAESKKVADDIKNDLGGK
jgi:hypothetical protein